MSHKVDRWTDAMATTLTEQLRRSSIRLKPKSVRVHQVTDAWEEEAWRITLILPASLGETWDRADVFRVRRAAIDALDVAAADEGRVLQTFLRLALLRSGGPKAR